MWGEAQARVARRLFAELTARQFEWAVIGNAKGLPDANPAKDIDLIVDGHRLAEAVGVLFEIAKSEGFCLVESRRFEAMLCSEFYAVRDDCVESVKIDLMTGFVWRGAAILDASDLAGHTVDAGGVRVPDRALNGFLMWIKPLLTGAGVKPKYRQQIVDSVEGEPQEFRRILEAKCGASMARQAWDLLRQGKLEATVPLARKLRAASWVTGLRREPAATLKAAADHLRCIVALRTQRRSVSMLAVVGPDGVGTTTFIDLLRQELARILVKEPESIKVSRLRPLLLPEIQELFRKGTTEAAEFGKPHRAATAGTLGSLARISYYWLDYVLGYWLLVRWRSQREHVYVFDRYFYDFLVDPQRSRISLPWWVGRAFLAITPEPSLVFFLDCPAEIVYRRKRELPLAEIERQMGVYRQLAAEHPERFVVLDATRTPAESCAVAVRSATQRLFKPM
jgi:thymidylate kinase